MRGFIAGMCFFCLHEKASEFSQGYKPFQKDQFAYVWGLLTVIAA